MIVYSDKSWQLLRMERDFEIFILQKTLLFNKLRMIVNVFYNYSPA